MARDSTEAGYLAPASSEAPEGQELRRALQGVVVGLTGLDGSLVRPRWQLEPPNTPDRAVNWAAIGVVSRRPDTYAAVLHVGIGDGLDELRRHETLETLASFYGPDADSFAGLFRDGLQIAQNRDAIRLAGFSTVATGEPQHMPELAKDFWRDRVDVPWTIVRQVKRTYGVLNLLEAVFAVYAEDPAGRLIYSSATTGQGPPPPLASSGTLVVL